MVLISTTVAWLERGQVDTNGMPRSPPTAPVRQPSLRSGSREMRAVSALARRGRGRTPVRGRGSGSREGRERQDASCDMPRRDGALHRIEKAATEFKKMAINCVYR